MALKKSELYSSLWASCDELRGGMDASQYKDYVLVLLFVKYVSDKYAGQPFAPITIPEGASFADMVALKGKSDIGDQINKKILGPLAKANQLSDMPDFNDSTKLGDGKEKVDRLTNLIAIFENPSLDFSKNRADGDDILGDAYEYLMRHFATESGKSKGQFYTPAEVSRILAQIVGIRHAKTTNETSVIDFTCGSGSLLLKVGDAASHDKDVKVTFYGQEKDSTTAGLARMNMILHDQATALIVQGNSLTDPKFKDGEALKTFDFGVINPPFSDKRWSTGLDPDNDPYERFKHFGIPPGKQGDYAYLLHLVRVLKPTGKGACILPHGVLFRGNAEAVIRRNLVERGYIKAIIGLPANLFYGTGIPACVLVIDKEDAADRKGIFMIDASKGFMKDGNKNRLRAQDIHRIVDTYNRKADVPRYSRMVPLSEIRDAKNDFNLNLPRYIDSTEQEDIQDINGHLRGGIPSRDIDALEHYWQVFPGVRAALFQHADWTGYEKLLVPSSEIKTTIFSHPEFTTFNETITKLFRKWIKASTPKLMDLSVQTTQKPKALIEELSENLLDTFEKARLIDPYDIYQHLMDYWEATMQDDVYQIVGDGWEESAKLKIILEERGTRSREKANLVVGRKKYKAELIPPELIIARYFAADQAKIEQLEADAAAVGQSMEEMAEEHSGEDGLLEEAKTDTGKLTRVSVNARMRDIKVDEEADEEHKVLCEYLDLIDKESDLNTKAKKAQEAMLTKVVAKYEKLTEAEIRTLVIEDKWLATLSAAIQSELDRVSQTLTTRIRQLADRYAAPLPQIADEVETLSQRVDEHLKKMGAVWT
jgi:type I restriction enzyme M protein